ncbi:hypothetical protein GGQ05_000834 [Salinibacter ruber]|uniref:PglZ domain-containing protein n=1 Tax=Salinibacter ruber TaxID=146919 RepID=UPI002166F3EC|nr:PglZ domain-containing protein [Salinibacter ruber]MCS4169390.1 hypothetical protein [Salinibacter ruber]
MKNEKGTLVEIYYYEEERIESVGEGCLVESPKDYLDTRKKIRENTSSKGRVVKVYINKKRYWRWLRDLREIGSPEVDIYRDNARRELENKWSRIVPDGLSSREIREMGLLDIGSPPAGKDVSDYILQSMLETHWLQGASPLHAMRLTAHVASTSLSSDNSDDDLYVSLDWLRRKQEERASQWLKTCREKLKPFYRLFTDHPEDASRLVCTSLFALNTSHAESISFDEKHVSVVWDEYSSSLSSGPHDLNDWLEIAKLMSSEETALCRRLEDTGRNLLHRQLMTYWNTTLGNQKNGNKDLQSILNLLPGNSLEELEALEKHVANSNQIFTASEAQTEALKERYGAFENGFRRVRSFLQKYTIPTLPPDPKKEWMTQSKLKPWKEWIERHYIPFKKSIDRFEGKVGNKTVKELEKKANTFTDWFTGKYKDIIHKGDDLITDVLKEVTEIAEGEKTVIWVIWDNLPASHLEKVVQSAGNNGFHPSKSKEWKLSVLPSVTEVCVPALLSGSPDLDKKTINSDRKKVLDNFTPKEIKTSYHKSLKELKLGEEKKDIYVLHYRDYDRKLHKKDFELEERRSVELKRSRQRIFEHLKRFVTDLPSDTSASVVISSDHGSTLLPEHSDRVQLPDGLDPKFFSGRAVALPNIEADPTNLFDSEITTVFGPEKTVLNEYCVMSRGFKSLDQLRSDDGYRHGGALPEEVFTPLLVLDPSRPEYTHLNISVTNSDLRRGEERSLHIKLSNHNNEEVAPVHVRLKKRGTNVGSKVIDKIKANTSKEVEFNVKVDKYDDISEESIETEVRLNTKHLGQAKSHTESISAPASERAVDSQTGEDLDSFFE